MEGKNCVRDRIMHDICGFTQVYVYSDYLEDIGVDFRVYRPQYKYKYYGTLLTTMRTFGYLHVTQPEEYSVNAVKKITKQYTENESTETQEKIRLRRIKQQRSQMSLQL